MQDVIINSFQFIGGLVMMKVNLFGIEETVEINENEVKPVTLSNGDIYEESFVLEDGRTVAYDEAICAWAMLGGM